MEEQVILVDREDRPIGAEAKMAAHAAGKLHRAFSVFLFDPDGRLLMQRRASGKYHSPGLWSNTCCGHPRPGEDIGPAATRRLREEMGITCIVEPAGAFVYRMQVGAGLIEHEYDHVFVGGFAGTPHPASTEVAEWRWVAMADLLGELERRPERYTAWLRPALEEVRRAGFPRDPS